MKVAIVGATGLVGQKMIEILQERNFPATELIPVASERSAGKKIHFKGKEYFVITNEEAIKKRPDFAIFSAGKDISLKYAPQYVDHGSIVIDNSSAWRMEQDVKLIVPEVNGHLLSQNDRLIANPNCSTIQMLLAIAPLHKLLQIKRLVVSTYQAVSGSGQNAIAQMQSERKGEKAEMVYPHPIDLNCLPQGGDFLENGYTAEEMKLVHESRKILGTPDLKVTATVVRIPVKTGHSESINIEFEKEFSLKEVKDLLGNSPGISLLDNPQKNRYPMPLYAEGKDDVFVGRLRKDESTPNALNMWVVSDNLRKGAATNAIQIAERMLEFVK